MRDAAISFCLPVEEQELEREFEARLVESSTLAFRVAFSVLRRTEDAEDVAQEAFSRAFQSFRRLRDRRSFRAWLVRTSWRLAIDRLRSERRRTVRESEHVRSSAGAHMSDEAAVRERAAQLWQAIDALPKKLRIVTVLVSIEGHNLEDVAALLDLPLGTVKSRLFLARRRLKETLA